MCRWSSATGLAYPDTPLLTPQAARFRRVRLNPPRTRAHARWAAEESRTRIDRLRHGTGPTRDRALVNLAPSADTPQYGRGVRSAAPARLGANSAQGAQRPARRTPGED